MRARTLTPPKSLTRYSYYCRGYAMLLGTQTTVDAVTTAHIMSWSFEAWRGGLVRQGLVETLAVFVQQQVAQGHLHDTPLNFDLAFEVFLTTSV